MNLKIKQAFVTAKSSLSPRRLQVLCLEKDYVFQQEKPRREKREWQKDQKVTFCQDFHPKSAFPRRICKDFH